MKKSFPFIYTFLAIALCPIVSAAPTSSNLKLTAKVTPGCVVSVADFSLGNIKEISLTTQAGLTANSTMNIQCSKTTTVNVQQQSSRLGAPSGENFSWLHLLGNSEDAYNKNVNFTNVIWYRMYVDAITSPEVTITKKYSSQFSFGVANHSVDFLLKTKNKINVPLSIRTHKAESGGKTFLNLPGNYVDVVNFTFTY